jgi:hypothetical protein
VTTRAALLGREFIGTELDLNLFKRASKFEWHLRVVLVDDWRSGILTAARFRNLAKLADGQVNFIEPDWRPGFLSPPRLSPGLDPRVC